MPQVSMPDLLKAAERPLALFLEDALRSVHEDPMVRIVQPFVATAANARLKSDGTRERTEYSGNERLVDGRNQPKTSLTQCDLQFLTQVFEFAVKNPARVNTQGLVYPNLNASLPFSKDSILNKIHSVRRLRNDWAHDKKEHANQHQRLIEIAKLLDLFKEEIQHVVQQRPQIFSEATKQSIDSYVAALSGELASGEEKSAAIYLQRQWKPYLALILLLMMVFAGLAALGTFGEGGLDDHGGGLRLRQESRSWESSQPDDQGRVDVHPWSGNNNRIG